MMYASNKDFIKDFAKRTIQNYNAVKNGPYEVTQLINSAIGLLIIPEQTIYDQITDDMIPADLLQELEDCIKINTYNETNSLQMIAKHIRNGIAHGKLKFTAEQPPLKTASPIIKSVTLSDEFKNSRIEIELTLETLERFFLAFAEAASEL